MKICTHAYIHKCASTSANRYICVLSYCESQWHVFKHTYMLAFTRVANKQTTKLTIIFSCAANIFLVVSLSLVWMILFLCRVDPRVYHSRGADVRQTIKSKFFAKRPPFRSISKKCFCPCHSRCLCFVLNEKTALLSVKKFSANKKDKQTHLHIKQTYKNTSTLL